VTPPASLDNRIEDQPTQSGQQPVNPGTVAGAVLRAARLSADISGPALAAAAGVAEYVIRSWEDGSSPLAEVPFPLVERLEAALTAEKADPRLVADLSAALWCDLLITTLTDGQDTACLLADPITAIDTFCELLAWAACRPMPTRYRPYAAPRPLLADPAVIHQVTRLLDAMPAQLTPTPAGSAA
jgi:transcriptional regulator with XRE-family HTH domain